MSLPTRERAACYADGAWAPQVVWERRYTVATIGATVAGSKADETRPLVQSRQQSLMVLSLWGEGVTDKDDHAFV